VPAFLFDLDGVLVDTHELVIAGWRRFAATRGRTMSDEEIVARTFGWRTIDILVDVFGIAPAEAASMVAAGFDDKRAEVAAGPPLREVAGAAAFVRSAFAAGIPCAVASSASMANIELALDAIGLGGVFDVVVDQRQVRRGKPDPDPYLVAAAGLRVDPQQCVVFEDTGPGIAAGLAAGARVVGVATLGRPAMLERADLVIADFSDQTPEGVLRALAESGGHRRTGVQPTTSPG
jgi:beta-phosphoglucomutase-like phosphatase (HAD superfamily)